MRKYLLRYQPSPAMPERAAALVPGHRARIQEFAREDPFVVGGVVSVCSPGTRSCTTNSRRNDHLRNEPVLNSAFDESNL